MANFTGGSADDSFVGTADPDSATGNGGNDVLFGLGGNDSLDGGDGDDTLDGGSGDDMLYSHAVDPAFGGFLGRGVSYDIYADADTLTGGGGNDYLFAGYGDSVDGGAQETYGDKLFISFRGAPSGVVADFRLLYTQSSVTIAGGTITGVEEVSYIEGSEFADLLASWASGSGYTAGQAIYGRGGNDQIYAGYYAGWAGTGIYGGDGDDLIDLSGAGYGPNSYGESGDDHIIGGSSYERLDGGEGNDQIEGNYGYDYLYGGAGNDIIDGGSFDDNLYGEAGNDTLYGAGDVDTIDGGEGNDVIYGDFSLINSGGAISGGPRFETLRGGAGDDFVSGDGGDDRLYGDDGNDLLYGGAGDDALTGGAGVDRMEGGDGNDTGYGGDGDDLILAGTGTDQLSGEGDNDRLYFGSAFTGSDLAAGGAGTDELLLQGRYVAPITLGASNIVSIETLRLLSADDGSIVAAPGGSFSYSLAAADSLLAGGASLTVDASGLGAGEILSFDGSAEASGRFTVIGGAGADFIVTGAGNDIVQGNEADDVLTGGTGNDILRGGAGVDSLDGGDNGGIFPDGYGDRVSFYDRSATQAAVADLRTGIIANDGFGNVETMAGIESLGSGTAFADTFHGNDSINFLYGSRGDSLHGHGADDLLALTAAAALVDGGTGVDQLEMQAVGNVLLPDSNGDGLAEFAPEMTAGWNVDLAAGTLRDGYGNVGTVIGIEDLVGSELGDELRGNAGANTISGGGGGDLIRLQDGGADTASGGDGGDAVYFGSAFTNADVADGGAGVDVVVLQGNYTLTLSAANLIGVEALSLQSGSVAFWGDTANNRYDYSFTTLDGFVPAGVQMIVNGQSLLAGEDLTFDGSAESNGQFLIFAGHGVDTLKGGAGGDVFFFEGTRWSSSDTVDGGGGADVLVISAGSGLSHYEFLGSSFVNIEAISVSNRFTSDPSQKPSYELVLANANVGAGQSLIVNGNSLESDQTISIDGSAVQAGNLTLYGGAGNDALKGGGGIDLLYGADGADELTGGGGADVFRYDDVSESNGAAADVIIGFATGVDKIDLSRIDADTHAAGDQAFTWIGASAFAATGASSAGQLRAFEDDGQWRVEGDTNGDGSADFVLFFQPGTAPVQSDFLL